MKSIWPGIPLILPLSLALLVAGCVDVTSTPDDLDQPELRVHDVSGLNVENLDSNLNTLLRREDLPLRGEVRLLDDHRLAVNGSRRLQREIERILDDLKNGPVGVETVVSRPFRIQYWLLQMTREETAEDLPAGLDAVVEPMAEEFPGFKFRVQDFMESYHDGPATFGNLSSGAGTRVHFRNLGMAEEGVRLHAQINALAAREGHPGVVYQVTQSLQPDQALVLGRAHGGGQGEEAVYQVLIARMEWTD
jgi:hypothetical protein